MRAILIVAVGVLACACSMRDSDFDLNSGELPMTSTDRSEIKNWCVGNLSVRQPPVECNVAIAKALSSKFKNATRLQRSSIIAKKGSISLNSGSFSVFAVADVKSDYALLGEAEGDLLLINQEVCNYRVWIMAKVPVPEGDRPNPPTDTSPSR